MVDDVPIFVNESMDDPALPEKYIRGVGVVEGRKPHECKVIDTFEVRAVNTIATSKCAS